MDGFIHLDPIFPTRMLRRRSLLDSFGSISSQPSARRSLAPHSTYLSERDEFTNDSRRDIPINLDLELEQTSSRRIPRIIPRSRHSSNSTYHSESDDITNDSRRDFPINVDIELEETSSRRIPRIVSRSRQSSNSTYLSESDDIANDNRRDIPIDLDIEREQTSPHRIPLIVPRSRRTTFNYGLVSRDAPVSVEHISGNEVKDLIENPRNLRVEIEPRDVRETPIVSERASITGRPEFRRRKGSDDGEEKDYNRGGRDDTIRTNDEEEVADDTSEDAKEDLKITDIDYHVTDNAVAHKTDKFPHVAKGQLVVRRGQKFEVTVELNRSFDIYKDKLLLTLQTGQKSQPGKGTIVNLTVPDRTFTSRWRTEIMSNQGTILKIAITPDVSCIVGEWKMAAYLAKARPDEPIVHSSQNIANMTLFILFNSWSKDDAVYFPDTAKLSEYVLNDSGCMFTGTDRQIGAIPWFYGQFEPGILEATMLCLQKAFNFRSVSAMGDPVHVSRAISRIVNSQDDNGVMVGDWSGCYDNGRPPLSWVGSVAILRQYMKSGLPVKYGQCYAFAGVVTTMCRALGLPCRPVTNFSSAHDTDGSVTLDVHWDLTGNTELKDLNTDSMWNFHVFNMVWMRRKDLTFGHDGWQVIDATPQETSGGMYACGPSPVAAILNGRCDVAYDTSFLFAAVNADRVHWGRQKDDTWKVIAIETSATGKRLCTKVADGRPVSASLTHCDNLIDDVTDQFKHKEDTGRERASVVLASTLSPRARKDVYSKQNDIEMTVQGPDNVMVGFDVSISVTCKNKSEEKRHLEGNVFVEVITYTGKTLATCKVEEAKLTLGGFERKLLAIPVKAASYIDHVTEAAMLKVSILMRDTQRDNLYVAQETFRLRTPDLNIKCYNSSCQVDREVTLRMSFSNPLDRPLTQSYLYVESAGADDPRLLPVRSTPASCDMTCDVELTFQRKGRHSIYANFFCKELHSVKGVFEVYVQ